MDRFHTGWLRGLGVGRAARPGAGSGRTSERDRGLRDAVLPDFLDGLEDEHLRRACEHVADEYAQRHPDTAPWPRRCTGRRSSPPA